MSTKTFEVNRCTPATFEKTTRFRHLWRMLAGPTQKSIKAEAERSKSLSDAVGRVAKRTQTSGGPFGLEFQSLPSGEFQMGSNNGYDNERPVHRVVISNPFQMGTCVVTQGQWQSVMGYNPSYFKGDDLLPVEQVSWEDIQQFIARLNAQNDGFKYRLPTEAEWEYAARTGQSGDRTNGIGELAWYAGNSGGKTHPVGTKNPNTWGLYDMFGNVWEWMQDCYDPSYYANSAAQDPSGPPAGIARTHRGGAWGSAADFCCCGFRIGCQADARYNITGFRLVRNRTI